MAYRYYNDRFETIDKAREFLSDNNIKCIGIYIDTEDDKKMQPLEKISPGVSVCVLYQKHNDHQIIERTDNKGNRGNFGKYGY